MRPIIIGAGRGSRLNALTDSQPKSYAPVGDRRILDWILQAMEEAGLGKPVFIGGYQIDAIRADYPHLEFCHNDNWPNNNILASLFYAEDHMSEGFVCSYADILYRGSVIRRAIEHEGDIVLCVDTDWRRRYADRTQHPEDDAEKVLAEGDRVIRITRDIPADNATGEYIGVARFSPRAVEWLHVHHNRVKELFSGHVWRDGTLFEKAYLIHLFQEMLEQGLDFHMVTTDGKYMEVDTEEDYALACEQWPKRLEKTECPQLENYGVLFPTAVVGSMPRPDAVRELVLRDEPPLNETEQNTLDSAVADVIALQERAGLDVITDGEWRRASYIGVIAEIAHGFEKGTNPLDGRPWTIVVDRLTPRDTGFIAAEARFLKASTKARIKATLPSPALLGERMWDPDRSAAAYPERRDFVRDCVPILRREAELLRDEGVDIIQIDDPHLCLLVDPDVRASYNDPDEQAAFAVEMVNDVVSQIDGARFAVHLCRRAGARVRGEACHTGGYGPILNSLNHLQVQHLTMEFTSPGAGDAEVFGELRDDFEIGLGCLSVHPGEVDLPETIVARVERAMEFLPAERIVLNPDCGFAPGSAAQADIGEVEVKLGNMVTAAKVLRERYG